MSKLPKCSRCGERVPARVLRRDTRGLPQWLCAECDDLDAAQQYDAERERVRAALRAMVDEEHQR